MHAITETEHLFSSKEEMVEHMKAVVRAGMMDVPESIREELVAAIVDGALDAGMGRNVSDEEAESMMAEAVKLDD